jgi:hypothetical protein
VIVKIPTNQLVQESASRHQKKRYLLSRNGQLYRYLPADPAWCRRIGGKLRGAAVLDLRLTRQQERQIEFAYDMAVRARGGARIGPTYPEPTHPRVETGRAAQSAAFDATLAAILAFDSSAPPPTPKPGGLDLNDYPPYLVPPSFGFLGDTGLGKTRDCQRRIIKPLVDLGKRSVIFIPRHKLGAEIVVDLAAEGVGACEYRGRERR